MNLLSAFPTVGALIFILALAYTLFPESITGKKNKYVLYVLFDISLLWIIDIIIFASNFETINVTEMIAVLFIRVSAAFYWLFPFKEERNKTFSFLISAMALIEVVAVGLIWLLMQFSQM